MRLPSPCWHFEAKGRHTVVGLAVERRLWEGRTEWQQVQIFENQRQGRYLVLDGELQSASADEHVYHETLVHPALLAHPAPRHVLIMGGGEGATLREVLRHPKVEQVTMVELDERLLELCKRLLPDYSAGAFEDPRARVICADALHWLRDNTARFDVILSDLTEPEPGGLSEALFGAEFFRLVKQRLKPGGFFALQSSCGCPGHASSHCAVLERLAGVFPVCRPLAVYIESFSCLWTFIVASCGPDPRLLNAEAVDARLRSRGLDQLRWYDGESHVRMFSLPRHLRDGSRYAPGPSVTSMSPASG